MIFLTQDKFHVDLLFVTAQEIPTDILKISFSNECQSLNRDEMNIVATNKLKSHRKSHFTFLQSVHVPVAVIVTLLSLTPSLTKRQQLVPDSNRF